MTKISLGHKVPSGSAKLKWAQGETKRIALLSKEFEIIRVHNMDKNTYLCHKDHGKDCPHCEQSEFKHKLAVNVLVYDPNEAKFSVSVWVFSQLYYEELIKLKDLGHDLTAIDLSITCTNSQFQNLTIAACPDTWWKLPQYGGADAVKEAYKMGCKNPAIALMKWVILPGQQPRNRSDSAKPFNGPPGGAAPATQQLAPGAGSAPGNKEKKEEKKPDKKPEVKNPSQVEANISSLLKDL